MYLLKDSFPEMVKACIGNANTQER